MRLRNITGPRWCHWPKKSKVVLPFEKRKLAPCKIAPYRALHLPPSPYSDHHVAQWDLWNIASYLFSPSRNISQKFKKPVLNKNTPWHLIPLMTYFLQNTTPEKVINLKDSLFLWWKDFSWYCSPIPVQLNLKASISNLRSHKTYRDQKSHQRSQTQDLRTARASSVGCGQLSQTHPWPGLQNLKACFLTLFSFTMKITRKEMDSSTFFSFLLLFAVFPWSFILYVYVMPLSVSPVWQPRAVTFQAAGFAT